MAKRAVSSSELVGSIYAAVENPAEWITFLERLKLAMKATGAAILHYDAAAPAIAVNTVAGFGAAEMAQYHRYYSQLDRGAAP